MERGLRRWSATVSGQRLGLAVSRISDITGAPVVAARVAGVGAPGRVVSAVFVPGRAQLAFSLPFVVDAQVDETVIAVELQRFLIEER